jgi:glycosyltransferase involved in cell wall biosynthesis
MTKVVLCVPTLAKPYQQCLDSIKASVPLLDAAGFDHSMVNEIGCPYISAARATMLRKALDAKADVIVFIDHDLSWDAQDLIALIKTPGDVVAGTYRFKRDSVEYMGSLLTDADGFPISRPNGTLLAHSAPAGFLKITEACVDKFIRAYPHLCYGKPYAPSVDLFNHGAHKGVWWGEDYAFSRNWRDCGGEVLLLPKLNLTHHTKEQAYPGNFHEFLLAQPGGSNHKAQ